MVIFALRIEREASVCFTCCYWRLSMLLGRRLASDAERKLISSMVDKPGTGTGTGTEADNLTPKQRRRAQVRKAQMYVAIQFSVPLPPVTSHPLILS